MKEAFLEPILRSFRLRQVKSHIRREDVVLDVGCGWNAKFVRAIAPYVKQVVGVDKKVELDTALPQNASVFKTEFGQSWNFPEIEFSCATMLAVLEHLYEEESAHLLSNIFSVLRPGGRLILTVPTPRAKPVLEFLAFKLGIVSRIEIEDHKIYYDRELLKKRLENSGFVFASYKNFQVGMNSFCIAIKPLT